MYNFGINLLLNNINLDDVKLQQIKFLKDLMNGFEVYKTIKQSEGELNYKAKDLYLILLENRNKTVNDICLNNLTDNKEIYLQVKILFNLREKIFKKLFNKGIIRSDSDQSDIVGQKYEENIVERTKLRRERSDKIVNKEKTRNLKLFKNYFNYQSPCKMYNTLSDTKNTEKHNI